MNADEAPTGPGWYVLHVKPRTEKKVMLYLSRYNASFRYLPVFVKVTNMTGRPAAVSIDLGGQTVSGEATLTTYSAKSLDDMDAVLESRPFKGGSKMQLAAGPYSLSIIRLGDGVSTK